MLLVKFKERKVDVESEGEKIEEKERYFRCF